MVSVDLFSCHEVFDAVFHSVGIAIASVTLFFYFISVCTAFSFGDFSANIYNVSLP